MTMLDTDQPIHEQIDTYRDAALSDVPPDVRDYYRGDQPIIADADQRAALGDRANRPLIENMVSRCVDAIAARLVFERFVAADDTVQEALDSFATMNHFGRKVIANTVRALVDGNTANSLAWDKASGRVIVYHEPWWDGDEGMYVESSENGNEEWAVKEWTDRDKRKRRTVYLPDQIQRFVQDGQAWLPFGDDETHIQPWVKTNGQALGVPVIHFANAGATDSVYGDSKVAPLLGLQDALNGALFDIIAAQAMTAFGVYTATGVTSNSPLHVGPGRLWRVEEPDAKFGILNGASMEALEDGYRIIKTSFASQFPIADHVFTGQWPSGAAFVRAEAPMTGYVTMLGEEWAPGYVRLAHRATEMMNAYGAAGLDEDALIRVAYEPAEQLDDGTIAEIDRERVETYRELATLPRELMVKSKVVTSDEADTIVRERSEMDVLIADAGF